MNIYMKKQKSNIFKFRKNFLLFFQKISSISSKPIMLAFILALLIHILLIFAFSIHTTKSSLAETKNVILQPIDIELLSSYSFVEYLSYGENEESPLKIRQKVFQNDINIKSDQSKNSYNSTNFISNDASKGNSAESSEKNINKIDGKSPENSPDVSLENIGTGGNSNQKDGEFIENSPSINPAGEFLYDENYQNFSNSAISNPIKFCINSSIFSYPIEAVKLKIEGKVILKLKVNNKGNVVDVELIQSSGNKYLDDYTVNKAKLLKFSFPTNLSLQFPLSFTLGVVYKLKNKSTQFE